MLFSCEREEDDDEEALWVLDDAKCSTELVSLEMGVKVSTARSFTEGLGLIKEKLQQ